MTLLLGIAGCVSSADSVLGVSQSLSANETDAATAIEATEASASSGTTADLPADTNAASAPGTLAADEIVAANVVPEPAPRDGAGNPLLMEGTVLAFADAEESPREDVSEAAPPAVDVTGTIRHAPVNASAAAAPKSLFEMLRRQQLKTTSDNHTHLASLNTTVPADGTAATSGKAGAADSTAGGSIAGGASQLPGVSKHGNLFGEDEGDHASDDNPFEVASVGAFGRVSPNGLHLQTGKVHAECLKPGL
ncbi:MAG: hypothetical protein LJE67_10845, partial [Salaquimonas sp.]|nr:hypothetical protein [Salaquimonas sp.]